MFRPYRTLKIKVPRPCCPWCQSHSERFEQKLQAMEKQLQELSTRLASTLATTGEAEKLSAGFLTALEVFGLTSSPHRTGEDRLFESLPRLERSPLLPPRTFQPALKLWPPVT